MSNDAPKLYIHKPKKALLKKHLQQQSRPSPSTAAPPPPPVVPPKPTTISSTATPKESFARRYRFMWPLLLAVNFSVGGSDKQSYLFMRTKKKENIDEVVTAVTSTSTPTSTVSTASVVTSAVVEPMKVQEPIPLDQQRELFKWILEEKRKLKPNGPEEKKRIDEEKAILKQLIRAKSIPSL
ncbi:hypothetical protein Tco_0438021 [Tanacetum coccineum]